MRNAAWVVTALCVAGAAAGQDAPRKPLMIRPAVNHLVRASDPGVPVPPEAVRVYLHEGEALEAWVHPGTIAVEYPHSGVVFDRATGAVARRLTILDGWPATRGKEFPAPSRRHWRLPHLVGPGVLDAILDPDRTPRDRESGKEETYAAAATAVFGGQVWQAMQPRGFFQSLQKRAGDYGKQKSVFGSWTNILNTVNAESFLQSRPVEGEGETVRYTMAQGLPSNLVTHLATAEGKLWAACVDIYEPTWEKWGPGGLACYDPKTRRWSRVEKIGGRPVRWVTLLQTVGEDLWVGFREGAGVLGDKVNYGMGLYPGQYRPVAKAIVLGRLSKGKWTTYSRPPVPMTPGETPDPGKKGPPEEPGETPRTLTVSDRQVFLFSQSQARVMGNWDVDWAGMVSVLDTGAGRWRSFDTEKELAAYELRQMVASDGEILVMTDRGVRRWSQREQAWRALDPGGALVNPSVSAVVPVGNELWVGYTNQSFGVMGRQGISRFNEETMTWTHVDERQIGTACPVQAIVPMAGGEVLVLFRHRVWYGSAGEFAFYPREPRGPEGLGRVKDGAWQFPVRLEGVPENRSESRPGGSATVQEKLPITGLLDVGGKVFVSNYVGIYEGPGPWRKVVELSRTWPAPLLSPSADRKRLEIWHDGRLIEYDPATGRAVGAASTTEEYNKVMWPELERGSVLHGSWTEIPTIKPGSWAIGEIDSQDHRVVETPRALWLVSTGQLIRLDRQLLREWLGGHE